MHDSRGQFPFQLRARGPVLSHNGNHRDEIDQAIKASEGVSPMALGPVPMTRDLCLGGAYHVVRIEAEVLGDDLHRR
jgi:hypothetical protein